MDLPFYPLPRVRLRDQRTYGPHAWYIWQNTKVVLTALARHYRDSRPTGPGIAKIGRGSRVHELERER